MHDLVAKADAVLDNYSVDVVERIGFGLRATVQGQARYRQFAHAGTRHHRSQAPFFHRRREYHRVYRSDLHVESSGRHQSADRCADWYFPDYVSGVLCAIIIISGVLYRDRQKKGAFIDLAQSEATAFMIGANLDGGGIERHRSRADGQCFLSVAPHDCYPCKGEDRWCVIAAETEQQWTALAQDHRP